MQTEFGGHWLAFLWKVTLISQLQEAVAKMKKAGANVAELVWHALNDLSPRDTATALKKGGINRAVQCVFFPDDPDGTPPMGDPISDDSAQIKLAQENLLYTIDFITKLQGEGIEANMIVGPSCLVLGKANTLDWAERKKRIIEFYVGIGKELVGAKIKVAIEVLRPDEDKVIEGRTNWIDLIDSLNAKFAESFGVSAISTFGAHFDTVHVAAHGWDQGATIGLLGKRIIHVHVNGTLRRPAGGEGDLVNWSEVVVALTAATQGRIITCINEPFCALVRQNCAPLGVGLPAPVEEPGGMILTRKTLVANGAVLVNA